MITKINKNQIRKQRHVRVRNHISGTAEKPRLCVYRSLNHIYTQLIDDVAGKTLAAASTKEKDIAEAVKGKTKSEQAKAVGSSLAKKALEKGVKAVVFDRGGYLYTGRVKAVADGAREAGLEF